MWQQIMIAVLVIISIVELVLALAVVIRAPRSITSRYYMLLTLQFVIWGITSFYDQSAPANDPFLPVMALIPFVAATGIAYYFAAFAHVFPLPVSSQAAKLRIRVLGVVGLILVAIILSTDLIVAGVTSGAEGNNVLPGRAFLLFTAYFLGSLLFGFGTLIWKYRHDPNPVMRRQISYVFAGLFLTLAVGFTTNVLLPLVLNNPLAARFGFLAAIGMVGMIGYAVVVEHLFDLRMIVARAVAYTLVTLTLVLLYAMGLFAVAKLLFPDSALTSNEIFIFVLLAVVISFTVPSLRRFFEKVSDRVFFRNKYDVQKLLDEVSSVLATELELKPLSQRFLRKLLGTMHISNGELVVMDGAKVFYEASYGHMPGGNLTPAQLGRISRHSFIYTDELAPGPLRTELDGLHIRVSLELRANRDLVGYLVLGDKLSGQAYSDEDFVVLEIIRKELALAVANAKAYDEISQFNVTLQRRIREATGRLKVANRNLRALDKTKDEFISMASHQLGTPLTAITGYLAMALDNDKHNMTADQREFVSYALEAAEKMVYMAGDMLNVSRLNSGRFMIQRQPTELVKIINQEIHQLQPSAQRKGLALTADLPDQPVTANLDESKTRQVIMNFIDNALYYTQEGGVHVKLEAKPGSVTFTVTDTGIGVAKAEQGKLFAKFFRAPNAKSVRPDGTGLGLYLAKRVIEDQGGQIIFASEEGKGSTFGFTLPI